MSFFNAVSMDRIEVLMPAGSEPSPMSLMVSSYFILRIFTVFIPLEDVPIILQIVPIACMDIDFLVFFILRTRITGDQNLQKKMWVSGLKVYATSPDIASPPQEKCK